MATIRVSLRKGAVEICRRQKVEINPEAIATDGMGADYIELADLGHPLLQILPRRAVLLASLRDYRYADFLPEGSYGHVLPRDVVGQVKTDQTKDAERVRQIISVLGPVLSDVLEGYQTLINHKCRPDNPSPVKTSGIRPLREVMALREKEYLKHVLWVFHGRRHLAADALGINRTTLNKKMHEHGLFEGAAG